MKRLILTTTGTVAGLAALLSFKTQTHPLANAGPLPSAGVGSTSSATTPSTGSATSPAHANSAMGKSATAKSATAKSATGKSTTGKSTTKSTATAGTAAKTYVGSAITTRYGIVQVKATIAGGKITDVAFVQLTAFDGHSQEINSYAGPALLKETLQQQSAHVDTVSGASYTSDGYRQSLQSALDQAGLK